jgi:hypothetical protein
MAEALTRCSSAPSQVVDLLDCMDRFKVAVPELMHVVNILWTSEGTSYETTQSLMCKISSIQSQVMLRHIAGVKAHTT